MSLKLHVPETVEDPSSSSSSAKDGAGPLTRFARSPWVVVEGLAFLTVAAGITLATAYLTRVDVWYKPDVGWGETVSYPNVWSWFTFPCYAIGWALLASWYWERHKSRRKSQA